MKKQSLMEASEKVEEVNMDLRVQFYACLELSMQRYVLENFPALPDGSAYQELRLVSGAR